MVLVKASLKITRKAQQTLIEEIWLAARQSPGAARGSASAPDESRESHLAELAAAHPYCYVPRFYEPEYRDGRFVALQRTRSDVPETIEPSVISDLDSIPLPTSPIVPYVECVHDRIAIEIMRGCPWQCRFCQSTVIKRPLRIRSVQTIVDGALESYRNTGFNEISILSLSSSDYPHFEELVLELKRVFRPLGVSVSVPSLRVNEQLRSIAELIGNDRRSGLTLAPEVARDDMREQIRKRSRMTICTKVVGRPFAIISNGSNSISCVGFPANVRSIWMALSKWRRRLLGSAKRSWDDIRR